MAQTSVFKWREGVGWLVLSGGGNFRTDETVDIETEVLNRTLSSNPLAYVTSDITAGDDYLTYIQELGGRTGYQVDLLTEDQTTLHEQLVEAGIIVLADTPQSDKVAGIIRGRLRLALEQAYAEGATIYAQGRMASLMAAWLPAPLMGLQAGLGWLENAVLVSPHDPDKSKLPELLKEYLPAGYGVGIGRGSALALSPDGRVEIWGQSAVKVVLGQAFKG